MITEEALKEIERLSKIYEQRWDSRVCLLAQPRGLTQERLAVVLERIIDTGESILVGYNAIFLADKPKILGRQKQKPIKSER